MIARLHGRVVDIAVDSVVVDVGGVGYRVNLPDRVLGEIGPVGASVTLHTYMHVREKELALYGARDSATLESFRMLLDVSGIGPRLALAAMSVFDATQLQQAIMAEDSARLAQVPGIGPKMAKRIVLELKGRLEKLGVVPAGGAAARPAVEDTDAVAALTSLGYSVGEARRAIAEANVAPDAELDERILGALRLLGGG